MVKSSLSITILYLVFPLLVNAQQLSTSELTGSWYNPSRSGEGILLEVIENDRALITWYTYDTSEGRQIWLLGVGMIENNSINNVEMTITSGAHFGNQFDQSDLIVDNWGTININFSNCNRALLTYETNTDYGSGEIELVRLTSIYNHRCDNKRDFLMGFTPFPSAISQQGIDNAYNIINEHADIVAHHFDNGIPWPEMLNHTGFEELPQAIQDDWQNRKNRTKTNKQVYLAITPIAISRDQLAPYKAEQNDIPLTTLGEPWASAGFDHPAVKQAYLNYAITAIEYFQPDYLAIGIEVNLLINNAPDQWSAYLQLHQQTYQQLHSLYPTLPIFVSFVINDFYPGLTDSQPNAHVQAMQAIENYSDYIGLSVYPYISALLTDPIPSDYLKIIDDLTQKPIAITESGYLAEPISLNFGNNHIINYQGSEKKQEQWIDFLLRQATQRDFVFVINFISKDYDVLCQQISCADRDRLWEDTGLIDENNNPRPALTRWREYLIKPFEK